MTAIHKKRLVIIAILTACAMFVIGLFLVYKPIRAGAELTRIEVELGGELSATQETARLELWSEEPLEVGDRLTYGGESAVISEEPSEIDETDYYVLSCIPRGAFYAKQGERITVSVNPPTEALSFNPGAQASLETTNLYRLRFSLYVSESVLESGDMTLTVKFNDGYGEECLLGLDSWEIESTEATRDLSGYSFPGGFTTIYIYVTGPLKAEMQLRASIGDYTATSDARSIYQVWEKALEDDFGGMVVNGEVRNYIEQVLSFSESAETFEISTMAQLSSSDGLSFLVKVPENYLELLNRGNQIVDMHNIGVGIISYTYEDYFLMLNQTSDLNDYGSSKVNLFGYMGHKNPEECIEPYKNAVSKLPEEILKNGIGKITLPVPTNANQTYYYYLTLVKVRSEKIRYITHETSGKLEIMPEAYSTNYYENTIKNIAIETLEREAEMRESEREWLQDIAGVKPDTEEISVTLKYKAAADYADIEEQTYTFSVKSTWAQNKTLILSALYDLTPYKNIAELNVVYTADYWQDGYVYKTGERIILQARDFEYTYNEGSQAGTLEVIYNNFQYKDLSLRITNNDPLNNLTLDYYTADAVVGETTTTLTYNFAEIEEQLHNSCNWLFDFGKENIQITGTAEGVTTKLTDTALIVTFENDKEKELVNLSLIGVAEIIEDIEYTLTYEYAGLLLSGTEIIETVKTSSPITKMYSEIVTCNFTNFMTDYGEIVNEAINPDFLGGAEYYIPVSIQKEYSAYDAEKHTCKITVEYSYNTLFGITNNYDESIIFKALNHSSLNYTGGDFVDSIPDGYRVESLTTEAAYKDKLTITNAENYLDTRVQVKTSTTAKEVLPIVINYTDSWNLTINYLENYADQRIQNGEKDAKPCFAEKKVFSGAIKVKDYADIYNLTAEDVKEILGLESLDILGLATVEEIAVKFDGVSTYTVDLSYSHAALKQIDYDGNTLEIKIPLTSYAEWCKQYGQDWSILFLNTPERKYFKYSNDVSRENLYGFFSVAVFKEQVSDLNYWFKNNTGDGCMTIFEGKEVSGAGVYKFFDNLTDKGILMSALGYIGMSFCEIVDDENAMYYSYFFYLDGTSDDAYLATNGADDSGDTGSAIGNAWNDFTDWIGETWDKLTNSKGWEIFKIVMGVVLVILVVVAVVALTYKLLTWSGVIKPKKKTSGSTTKKKTTSTKKKSTGTKK